MFNSWSFCLRWRRGLQKSRTARNDVRVATCVETELQLSNVNNLALSLTGLCTSAKGMRMHERE